MSCFRERSQASRDFSNNGRTLILYTDIASSSIIPQETMFWRRRVWEKVGPIDTGFHYAMDWDFMLRAEADGFKMERMRRFLACFRVHDEQKTTRNYERGREEMQKLRRRSLGYVPSQPQIYRAMMPYLVRQLAFHWSYRLGMLKR
jgi:GT2 family glycosyltransferase